MIRRLSTILCLAALVLPLGGCGKCGWFWEGGPRSCHTEQTR